LSNASWFSLAGPRLLGNFLPLLLRQKRDADSSPRIRCRRRNHPRAPRIIRAKSGRRACQWIYWTNFGSTPANVERWQSKRGLRRIGRSGGTWLSGGCVAQSWSSETALRAAPIRRACIDTASAPLVGCTTRAFKSGRKLSCKNATRASRGGGRSSIPSGRASIVLAPIINLVARFCWKRVSGLSEKAPPITLGKALQSAGAVNRAAVSSARADRPKG
jgi:hypothetical protein